jgi:hypothetical protein
MPEQSGARGKESEGGMAADGEEKKGEVIKDDGSGQHDKTKQSGSTWTWWLGGRNQSPTDSEKKELEGGRVADDEKEEGKTSETDDEEEDSSTGKEATKDSGANEEKVFVPVDDPTVFNKYGLANGKLLSYQLRGALRGFIDSDLAVAMAGQEAVNSAKSLMEKRHLR